MARRDHIHVDGAGPRVRGGVLGGHSHKTHSLGHVAVLYEPKRTHALHPTDQSINSSIHQEKLFSNKWGGFFTAKLVDR